jgi:putative ABC transport system ATP-binding protein
MSNPVITIRKVSKHYGRGAGRQQVLYDVNVEVLKGELVSIVGTSGSGKSTLLNVIGGLDREYNGAVTVLEEDYGTLTDRGLARLRNNRIGFVFQAFNLLDHLTCWENVALPAFFGRHAGDARAIAREQLERVGLEDKINIKPGNLSGGQKQRVAIARALFNRPDLLLCDEPTGNLDTRTGQQIIDLFSSLNKNMGITVIIVTHELRVSQVADRCIRLEDGRVTANGAPDSKGIIDHACEPLCGRRTEH